MKRPTREEINRLPRYEGVGFENIHLIEEESQVKEAIGYLQAQSFIGFDTESKPVFEKGQSGGGPTLIQLASLERVYLLPTRFDAGIKVARAILSDDNVVKLGFGLKGDRKSLSRFNIDLTNTLDLSLLLKKARARPKSDWCASGRGHGAIQALIKIRTAFQLGSLPPNRKAKKLCSQ